ncbi:MAG: hypothetical protein M0019_08580 [Actinomycetota bacterium]|nr:hypothetical protein [Actinomycetota bacterium]
MKLLFSKLISSNRRAVAAEILLVAIVIAAIGVGISFGAPASVQHQPQSQTSVATSLPATTTPAPSSTTTTIPPTTTTTTPQEEPGGGLALFPGKRIVAFYGAPGGGALGVLGKTSPEDAWTALMQQVVPYAQPGVQVIPAFELITYVAQHSPGPDGTYSKKIPTSDIQQYLNVVQEHDGLLILDIQPGRGSFLADAQALAPFLELPDVALGLDPEWEVNSTQVPGEVIGQTTATEVNQVASWLQILTTTYKLPQKLLLIHQFTQSMIQDKQEILPQPNLGLVFNMDGFGSWPVKVSTYHLIASEASFGVGMKLFYQQDTPLHPPSDVLALVPQPDVVEYQ